MPSRSLRTVVAVSVLALAGLAGCGGGGGDDPGASAGCRTAQDGRVEVVAKGVAWDTDCLEAPAGALTIVVDNRDDGVSHNLHLTDAPDGPKTDLEAGPVTQELDVSLDVGAYEYVCDIHPNMVGTLTVSDANPG